MSRTSSTQVRKIEEKKNEDKQCRENYSYELLTENKFILLSQPTEIIKLQKKKHDSHVTLQFPTRIKTKFPLTTSKAGNKNKKKRIERNLSQLTFDKGYKSLFHVFPITRDIPLTSGCYTQLL